MALPILDGNQTAATLSTIITGGQHIPAHTVVSIGTQAITDISGAISGSTVCVGNLGLLQSTVATEGLSASGSFIKIGGHTGTSTTGNIVHVSAVGALRVDGSVYTQPISIASVTISNFPSTQTIAGTVTANLFGEAVGGSPNEPTKLQCDSNGFLITSLYRSGSDAVNYDPVAGNVSVNVKNVSSVTIGNSVTISSIPAISGTVTVGGFSTVSVGGVLGSLLVGGKRGGSVESLALDTATGYLQTKVESMPEISGTVTANLSSTNLNSVTIGVRGSVTASIGNSVTIASLPAISGTVTANLSTTDRSEIENIRINTDTINLKLTSVTIGSLPLIAGTVTANLASVVTTDAFWNEPAIKITGGNGHGIDIAGKDYSGNRAILDEGGGIPVYPRDNKDLNAPFPVAGTVTASSVQGTSVTTSNFTSTTASTTLSSANSERRGLTVFNEGAGNLHICAGATATTLAYQVRLSAGDYWECPAIQTSLTHSAQFESSGTARVVEIT